MTICEGLDFSDEMLAIAEARGAYSKLNKAPWRNAALARRLFRRLSFHRRLHRGPCAGVGLDELARITRPGGHAIFTVRDTVLERVAFRDVFEWLEKADRWSRLEESPLFRAFAVAEPEVLVKAFVFEML